MPSPQVLLFGPDPSRDGVRAVLEQAGFSVGQVASLPASAGQAGSLPQSIVVMDAEDTRTCVALRGADASVPILIIGPRSDRITALEAGADAFLARPFEPAELVAQVQALLRVKERHDQLATKAAEAGRVTKRLQAAYQQIDQELALARRLQESFLPQHLPQLPGVRFAVNYKPCGQVGGDFYDVFRLDERHVGFYVADAMGHGVPASLLTIFVKKGIRAKEVFGNQYRLVPPGEVLSRLNKELIEQQLSENPFITMVYALLNFRDGTLHFARAGHPYPLYVPRDGEPSYWQVEGLLLGVVDATFPQRTHQLRRGDKVLFYSDGIDSATFDGREPGAASLLACAGRHRELPVREFVGQVARDLFGAGKHPDDLTVLGLEILE